MNKWKRIVNRTIIRATRVIRGKKSDKIFGMDVARAYYDPLGKAQVIMLHKSNKLLHIAISYGIVV